MESLFSIDWGRMWVPSTSILEMLVRGTIIYLGIFVMLRVVLKRQTQGISVTDILLIVLIADASQNGMAAGYKSITEGLVLVATLIFWDFVMDWLTYKLPALERLTHPPPLLLVRNGRMLRRNMRREFITEGELMTSLRHNGIEEVEAVAKAYMEADGSISVIKK